MTIIIRYEGVIAEQQITFLKNRTRPATISMHDLEALRMMYDAGHNVYVIYDKSITEFDDNLEQIASIIGAECVHDMYGMKNVVTWTDEHVRKGNTVTGEICMILGDDFNDKLIFVGSTAMDAMAYCSLNCFTNKENIKYGKFIVPGDASLRARRQADTVIWAKSGEGALCEIEMTWTKWY